MQTHNRQLPGKRTSGFSLIELMIAVAIIAILAAIAIPGYGQYSLRANRAKARAVLLQTAQWMERAATTTGAYPTGAIPAGLLTVDNGSYAVARTAGVAVTNSTFSLTATPVAGQANDPCGSLSLDNANTRTASGGSTTDCWGR